MQPTCSHIAHPNVTETDVRVCPECVSQGSRWVHLRLCLECGHVGCCDSSPNRHATKHHRSTSHPVVRSIEPGEGWAYCYVDDLVQAL
jgi:uncharacterized UBP type Zn finger protein